MTNQSEAIFFMEKSQFYEINFIEAHLKYYICILIKCIDKIILKNLIKKINYIYIYK